MAMNKLKRHLKNRKPRMTQKVLAEKAGVSEFNLSRHVSKGMELDDDEMGKIAQVLGVKKKKLFPGG